MALDPLTGFVVVLAAPAGDDGVDVNLGRLVSRTVAELMRYGVALAVVTADNTVHADLSARAQDETLTPPISWRADPADPSTWARLAPHIEQRVGPVDAVVADPAAIDTVEAAFAADMRRRGHGGVIPLSPALNPVDQLRQLLHRTP